MQQFRVEVCTFLVAGLLFLIPAARASDSTVEVDRKWPRNRIVISVSSSIHSAPNIHGDVAGSVEKSIDLWSNAGDLRFETVETDIQSVSPKGVAGDGISLITAASTAENLRLFPKQADSPTAVTRVFSDRFGNITEADIVLNPFIKFSSDGTFGTFDLQATITHEIGHLLGLDHSPIWGSVMFPKAGANFGLGTSWQYRAFLPEADAAAARALYGSRAEDGDCCAVVMGRLSGIPQTAKGREVSVWLEEIATGRVVAAAAVSGDGSYEMGGLRGGSYRLRVAAEIGDTLVASKEAIVDVSPADILIRNIKLQFARAAFAATLFGTSPQIARSPGVVRSGTVYSLFIGGRSLDAGVVTVGVAGTDLSVGLDSLRFDKYDASLNVMSLVLPSDATLPQGEYSVLIEDNNGVRRFLPGALVVLN